MTLFTTTTRILQGFPFLCKLRLLSFKSRWDYQDLNMTRKTKRILVMIHDAIVQMAYCKFRNITAIDQPVTNLAIGQRSPCELS